MGNLKEHLIDELDYVLVPTATWENLTTWYGAVKNQPPVHRKVRSKNNTSGQRLTEPP